MHDIISSEHFGLAQRSVQVFLANHIATRVIVPSTASATAFIAAGGRPDIVEVIANGIDGTQDLGEPNQLRVRLGLPAGNLVGVFSRLAPWKGQHVLLQALVRTSAVHCLIVGDALLGEDAYAANLRTMVDELGLSDRVHSLGHRNDIPELMRAVDVVVHPSIDPEPFGRTLVEAMLAGVPIRRDRYRGCIGHTGRWLGWKPRSKRMTQARSHGQ